MKNESAWLAPVAWLLLAAATLAIALPHVDDLGLYYDEAFLAQQARDFVEPERAGVHPPSVTTTFVAGRPFPVRNAAYLGSLKSQLLIPSLAVFGSSSFVLRATTLAIGLLGLFFCMLVTKRWFGAKVAVVSGVLIATDPSFFFFSQFEWGPFTSMLLCRAAGLYCLTRALDPDVSSKRWVSLVVGAVLMGLGVYSRVDFVVILGGISVAALVGRRDVVVASWQRHSSMFIVAGIVFAVSVLPVLGVAGQVLGAGAGISDRGDLGYRVDVLMSVLDGSHFHRLMNAGGLFDEFVVHTGPATAFPVLLLIAAVVLFAISRSRDAHKVAGINFLLLATALIGAGMLAIPGAVRAHHMLNVLPFPHIIVAVAGTALWQRDWSTPGRGSIVRGCTVIALAACLWSNAASIATTQNLIEDTGGTGRFSRALQDFVEELDGSPGAAQTHVISLDWGFHEIALFESDTIMLKEPIWAMGEFLQRKGRYVIDGDASSVYLFHEAPYDLFGFGKRFSTALEAGDASRHTITEHRDGAGGLVFKSVRFDSPHRMSFDGAFHIRSSESAPPRPAPAEHP